MKEINQILKNEITKQQKNLELYGDNYAKDLKNHSQKMKRVKNIAIVNAAKEYNKQNAIGYSLIRDSIALSEDRANHYGCKVGDVVSKVYVKSKDYDSLLCKTILDFRNQVKSQELSQVNWYVVCI